MNYKHLIKPVAVLALFCGAPVLQAQVLGGGAGGGLGGSLGGTLGAAWVPVGGMGQGNANGALGGSLERTDELRRHTTGAVDRTRETTGRVRDRVSDHARHGAGHCFRSGLVVQRDSHWRGQWCRKRCRECGDEWHRRQRQHRGQCRGRRERFAVRYHWSRQRRCSR